MGVQRVKLSEVLKHQVYRDTVQGDPLMTTDELKLYWRWQQPRVIVSADNTIAVCPEQQMQPKSFSSLVDSYFNGQKNIPHSRGHMKSSWI
jgi:hypothetical protein